MNRQWQRRIWASVFGTTAAFGLALGQGGGTDVPAGPPRAGDVMTLKFRDGPDRQVKILKVEKQPDGSYLSEVKDVKSGETFSLVDRTADTPATGTTAPRQTDPPATGTGKTTPKQPDPPRDREPLLPRAKSRPGDPLVSPVNPPDKTGGSTRPGTAAAPATMRDPAPEPPKRTGLLARIFGPKKTTPPASATAPAASPPAPTVKGSMSGTPATAMPPAVRPTPALLPPMPGNNSTEPPRTVPVKPVAPPSPVIPIPLPPPTTAPATTLPPLPLPTIPSIPMTPGGLPSIPTPPGGMSGRTPGVIQAGYASPATVALMQEVQQYVATLRTAVAPSDRILAVRSLAGCRHASTDTVKTVLFIACKNDPCPLVQACCIDALCKLGCYDPAFLAHLRRACDDLSDDVRTAAKEALIKMTSRR